MGGVPAFDQRGSPFGRVNDGDGAGGARIDTGAFESPPPPTLPADYNRNDVADAADYVLWRKTLSMFAAIGATLLFSAICQKQLCHTKRRRFNDFSANV